MIEILDDSQPWEIPLPTSWEDHDRVLEARDEARMADRWFWDGGGWRSTGPLGESFLYCEIVRLCMYRGWRLFSMPKGVQHR